eukprot:3126601-Rhodomonas_salina.4
MSGTDIAYLPRASIGLRSSHGEPRYLPTHVPCDVRYRQSVSGFPASVRATRCPLHPEIKYKKPHSWYKLY